MQVGDTPGHQPAALGHINRLNGKTASALCRGLYLFPVQIVDGGEKIHHWHAAFFYSIQSGRHHL